MNTLACRCLPILACMVVTAHAADVADGKAAHLRLSTAIERLDNGTPDWRESELGLHFDFRPRQALDLAVARTERFGLDDNRLSAAGSLPLSPALTAELEGNLSTTHKVLARHTLGAALQYEFAPAWLIRGGMRHSGYDTSTVNQGQLMLEHYVSDFSWAIGWRPTRTLGTTVEGVELRGAYYYGERNAVTLILASGKEVASIPGGVLPADVRSTALTGRHALDRRWTLTYALSHTRQGSLYTRNGINVGVQYAF